MTYELTSALGQPRQDFGRAQRSTPEAQFIFTVDGWQSEPIVVFMPRFCVSTIRVAPKLPPDNTACLSLVLAIHSGHSFFSVVKVHMHIRRPGIRNLTFPVDSQSILRNSHASGWENGDDTPAAGEYRALWQNAIGVHRHDVGVDEGDPTSRATFRLSISTGQCNENQGEGPVDRQRE